MGSVGRDMAGMGDGVGDRMDGDGVKSNQEI